MSLNSHIVDWDAAVRAARAGKLMDYLFRDYDNEKAVREKSLEDFTRDDTDNAYRVVGEAYRGLRRGLSDDLRKLPDEWFFRIFGRHAGPKWMADDPKLFEGDCFLSSFSPATVHRLAQVGSGIDFGGFVKAFEAKCPKDVLQELEEDAEIMGRAGGSFKGAFLPYVRGWMRFLKHVSAQRKGFLLYEG